MEGPPPARRLSCSDLPTQPRRSSNFSAANLLATPSGIPPVVPAVRARPADPSTSSVSATTRGASALPNSTAHVTVESSSSFPSEKIPPLNGNSSAHPPEPSSMPPQFTLGSAGGHIICQPSSDDHLYEANNSSGDHSSNLAAWRFLSPLSAAVRCCDVYIGMCGHEPSLLRFVNWLRAELQLHGVMCFTSDRSKCIDARAHSVAREAIESSILGVVVITAKTFSNPYSIEELKLFLERRNLVAIFFGVGQEECLARDIIERRGELWQEEGGFLWEAYGGLEEEWKEAVNGLECLDYKLAAHVNNRRDCIFDAVVAVGKKLGRSDIVEKVRKWKESVAGVEFLFPRNDSFVGRKKELLELELVLFGYVEEDHCPEMGGRRSFGRTLVVGNNGGRQSVDLKGKDQEPLLGKGLSEDRELEGTVAVRADYCRKGAGQARTISPTNELYGRGIACVCGESGIGKTELVLEFAYRLAQRYKMVLWIGGEARYLRQNYLNLLSVLGIELGIESAGVPEGLKSKGFEELEKRAICSVRKELMRDIPFLVVIDNLEGENDWWDERNLMELLPPFGGETHIIISTRLHRVLDLVPLRLLHLSEAEALTLMKGSLGDLSIEEVSALKVIEEKVGRVPVGLAIVRAILSQISIRPTKLLDAIRHMPYRDLAWRGGQDPILKYNPGMVQLLDLCFSIFDLLGRHGNLASRMIEACGWFAPSPIPVPLLAAVASSVPQEHKNDNIWKRWLHTVPCMRMSLCKQLEAKAIDLLVSFRVARCSTKNGFIHFHDIIKLYARRRGSSSIAHAMVQAVSHYGSPHHHFEHIWATSFLLFNFGTDPAIISLEVLELMVFIKKCILPLAWDASTVFFRRSAALELLHQAMKSLEAAKPHKLLESWSTLEKTPRWRISKKRQAMKSDSQLYEEFAALQATLLETISSLIHTGPTNSNT